MRLLAAERMSKSSRPLTGLPSLDMEFCFLQIRRTRVTRIRWKLVGRNPIAPHALFTFPGGHVSGNTKVPESN